MTFIWPHMLWLLLALPALVAAYIALIRRRKKSALRYSGLALVRDAMGHRPGWRRHVPPLLFLAALVVTIVAVARPAAVITLPEQQGTVILAVDVSASMRATDIAPSRLAAAQKAVRAFVDNQPRHVRIGVVAFAASAAVVQGPTRDREQVLAAVERLQLYPGTAVGHGIQASLAAIFGGAGLDPGSDMAAPPMNLGELGQPGYGGGIPLEQRQMPPHPDARPQNAPAEPGSHESAVIVLLTDGESMLGPDPIESAKIAANLGVRIHTVGLGTEEGATIRFMGSVSIVRVDVALLQEIARVTDGNFYQAVTAAELREVYETLSTTVVLEPEQTEITAIFSAAAGVLATLSVLLSLLWFNRIG